MKSKKVIILKEGERFGRLTVIREVEPKIYGPNGYVRYFLCKCDENGDGIEYTRTDVFIEKAKKAFCKASCNGHPPRSTCTSLGTCQKYDEFIKMMKGK